MFFVSGSRSHVRWVCVRLVAEGRPTVARSRSFVSVVCCPHVYWRSTYVRPRHLLMTVFALRRRQGRGRNFVSRRWVLYQPTCRYGKTCCDMVTRVHPLPLWESRKRRETCTSCTSEGPWYSGVCGCSGEMAVSGLVGGF